LSSAPSDWILDVNEANFEKDVVERSRSVPVVVDFWAPWCGPCRVLGPILERKVNQRGGKAVLAKVNIDESKNLASVFRVQSIPFVVALRDGASIDQFVGVLPESQIDEFLDRLEPSEGDKLLAQALSLEEVEPERAEALYREALTKEAGNDKALLGLTRTLLARDEKSEAREVIERVTPGGEHDDEFRALQARLSIGEETAGLAPLETLQAQATEEPENAQRRYELGCALAASGSYPEALAELLEAARMDKSLATEKVREIMVQIFYVVGVRSDLADDYRAKLSSLLY
jgi:putative thioredoxin